MVLDTWGSITSPITKANNSCRVIPYLCRRLPLPYQKVGTSNKDLHSTIIEPYDELALYLRVTYSDEIFSNSELPTQMSLFIQQVLISDKINEITCNPEPYTK
jgi:hypothetical protein